MTTVIPTLSADGFVDQIGQQADRLLSYFFASDFSQSNTYYGNISSLPYLVYRFGNDRPDMVNNTRITLQRLLDRFFDTVNLEVRAVDNPESPDDPRYGLIINAQVTRNDQTYNVGHEVSVLNSKIEQIARINNGQP